MLVVWSTSRHYTRRQRISTTIPMFASLGTAFVALAFLVATVQAQFDWNAYIASVTAQPPVSGSEADWFLDNSPNPLPMHPFRMRSRLQASHPKSCPLGTVWQMGIYRFWSDAQTTTPNLRPGTVAWGGCFPHMQIIHKGGSGNAWPVTMWKSISNSWNDMFEWFGDLSYSTVGNLDPSGNDNKQWQDRLVSQCAAMGGTVSSTRWTESLGTPVRNPVGYLWGDYTPLPPPPIGNATWTPYYDSCGYEMYMPDPNPVVLPDGFRGGRNRAKPGCCGPQYNMKPELPLNTNWQRVTDPNQYCSYTDAPPGATINPQPTVSASASVSTSSSTSSDNSAAARQARRRRRAANLAPRMFKLGQMTKSDLVAQSTSAQSASSSQSVMGVSTSQNSNGCNTFGPTRNVQTGFNTPGYDNFQWSSLGTTTSWPPGERTCTFRDIYKLDIDQFRLYPYDYPRLGFLMGLRDLWQNASLPRNQLPPYAAINHDAGFSLIMNAEPGNLYGMQNMQQYTKYGQQPNALWNEAMHQGTGNDYIMHVVKPVWNVPMGGTLYFLVAMRASNADRTCGPELDSYQISIDGDVVAGRQGIVIANSSVPGDDIVNVLVHGPSLNLAQGWHRLQIISNQRMPAGNPNAGQLRRLVTTHTFEYISNWPRITVNRVLRCSDFITYPYFTTDYRVGRYASGQIVEEGITNWDAGRMRFFQMTWFDNGRRAYQSNSIFEFDMAWLRTRRAFRSVVFYLNYLGVENFYDANITSVTLGVYAMRGELLPAQEYTTNWEGNTPTRVPNFSWTPAVESQLTRVGQMEAPLTPQDPGRMWTSSQYIPFKLDTTWFNSWSTSATARFTLVIRPEQQNTPNMYYNNLRMYGQAPGGMPPFVRFIPADAECNSIRA